MIKKTRIFPHILTPFLATMLLVGCGAAPAKETSKLADSAPLPNKKADAPASSVVRSKGLADTANDPKIAKAFKDVLDCPWSADDDWFASECPALVAFGENEALLGEDVDQGVLTLLNLLDDSDEKVRFLALDKMPSSAAAYNDKALASRILAQAERETTERCASGFGALVGKIDLKSTGLIAPVKRLVETHAKPKLRKSILGGILYSNADNRDAMDLVLAGLKSDDKDIRYTSVLNLSKGEKSFAADICPAFVKMLDDPSPDVVGLSAQNLGYVGKCTGQIDTLLAFATKRAAAGGEKLFLIANALGNLCENASVSDAQKKEAAKIARAFASGKNDSSVRSSAFYGVTSCDPAGAEAFLKGFLKNPDENVKKSAQERLAKLKKR
jgi:hypothetical protein